MRAVVLLLVLSLVCVSAAPQLRGAFQTEPVFQHAEAEQQQQAPAQGELISFLQSHQRAFHATQSSSQQEAGEQSPSQQAQQAAQQAVPQGAAEATSEGVLSALEHAPHSRGHHSLVQTGAHATAHVAAKAKIAGQDGDGEDFGPCKTCVFVLERIKKGSNMLLPAICSELYHKYPDAYALCHQVLNALSINGNNVRYWLFEGCFKYEIYQSKEWIKPCPSHVMCSVLKDLSAEPFCPALPMENPFAEAGGDAE